MRFYLTPTGTGMFNENQLIGQDTNGRDGWSLAWRYQDEPLLAHLTVAAVGANGTDSPWVTLGLHHPDPVARILSVTTTPTLPTEGGFLPATRRRRQAPVPGPGGQHPEGAVPPEPDRHRHLGPAAW